MGPDTSAGYVAAGSWIAPQPAASRAARPSTGPSALTNSSAISATRKPRSSASTGRLHERGEAGAFGRRVVVGQLVGDARRPGHRHAPLGELRGQLLDEDAAPRRELVGSLRPFGPA